MDKRYGFEDDIPHEEIKDTDAVKYSNELEKEKREKMERELKNDEKLLRWGGNSGSYFCLIIGAVMFVVGCVLCIERLTNKKTCTKRVHGEVIGFSLYEPHDQEEESHAYAPVFRYYYGDHEYTQKGKAYTGKDNLYVGKKLDIYIDPNDPTTIYVPEYKAEKKADIMLAIVGLIVMIVTFVYPRYRIKKEIEELRRTYESRL